MGFKSSLLYLGKQVNDDFNKDVIFELVGVSALCLTSLGAMALAERKQLQKTENLKKELIRKAKFLEFEQKVLDDIILADRNGDTEKLMNLEHRYGVGTIHYANGNVLVKTSSLFEVAIRDEFEKMKLEEA